MSAAARVSFTALAVALASAALSACNVSDTVDTPSAGPPVRQVQIVMCTSGRNSDPDRTCVVDGDTIWFEGESLRLESYDTPEPRDNICGGAREVALAKEASARLLELLNQDKWTVERHGLDPNGRTLATIRIRGEDVGDILIDEGLARRWPDGDEWWCN